MEQTLCSFLLSLIFLLPIGAWMTQMLTHPKIVPVEDKTWKIEGKRVINYTDGKMPSTDFIDDNYGNYDNHDFYLFTIKNKELRIFGLRRAKAEITRATMNVYDKSKKLIKEKLPVRYTTQRYFYVHNPLFAGNFLPKDGSINRQSVTLGDGQELYLIIASNPSKEDRYYVFTEQTDSLLYFSAEVNKIMQTPPFYIKIVISGDKFNEEIKLIAEEVNKGNLEARLTDEELL